MRNRIVSGFVCVTALGLLLICSIPAHAVPFTVSIGQNFTGSTFRVDSGFIPPDSNGAVGPSHFVELINGRYSVYQKSDGVRVQTSTLNQFWSDASVPPQVNQGAFDPRIVFDHASKRWFASSGQRTSNVLLGVSKSSDPTAGWTGFSIDLPVKGVFSDFPKLGVDADGVYLNVVPINSGFMGPGAFPNEILISVPKKDLVSPMPTVGNKTVFVTDFESGNARFQPAVDFGPSDGQAALLGAPRIFPASDKLNRTNVLNAAGPGPASLSATADITAPLLVSPPRTAVQPDGSSDLETEGSTGFRSSVLEVGDSLWAVNNVKIDNRNGLRWFEIDERTNVLLQTGTISDPLHDYFYPSIAANSLGDVLIGFNRSGLDEFVSSFAVAGDTLGGTTTFGDPILLQAGQANYFEDFGVGRNRWGDYSATTLDPNDPFRFWTIQEWVSSPDIWSTQITELIFTPIPEPSTLLLFGTGILGFLGYGWQRQQRAA